MEILSSKIYNLISKSNLIKLCFVEELFQPQARFTKFGRVRKNHVL